MSGTNKVINPLIALLIFGVIVVVMACLEIYERASIEIDGLIVGSEVVCQQPKNNRCVTKYQFKGVVDKAQFEYSAGPTESSLPHDLAMGASVKKHRWELTYEIDGKPVDDFPTLFYVGLVAIGLFAVGIWGIKVRHDARPKT